MISKFEMEVGGRIVTLETGRFAGFADGAVTVRYGETMVLVTACASKKPRAGADFLPLTIDVEEKMYAAGKVPGGFFRREGRPSSDAVLMARLTDRPTRPLFPKGFFHEVQVVATVLSADRVEQPDILGIIGASAALTISDIPFNDPYGACRIGLIDGELVVNPTYEEAESGLLDLVVAGTGDAVMMVEAGAREVGENVMVDALRLAQEVNGAIVDLIREIQEKTGKKKWSFEPDPAMITAERAAKEFIGDSVKQALATPGDKQTRQDALDRVEARLTEALGNEHDANHIKTALHDAEAEAIRDAILHETRRADGRGLDEIRSLSSETGLLPRVHGSGLFTRGETQVLSSVTLASLGDAQRIDTLNPETRKRFLHHYNFPPYSVGEVRRMFTGRREVGHGALAERALKPVVPGEEDFPYTLRVVSEVLASNGSSSMASVCGATLALMDAGVPIKAPVAGIAMGLITGPNGEAAVLTDIQGAEDHCGDMDFKVAGTADGITALQMDIKVKGITFEIMEQALEQARTARLAILDHLTATLAAPREDLSPFAPRMLTMKIPTDRIGAVIGPGGSVIRKMIDDFGVSIDVSDDGTVVIGSPDRENAEKAKAQIEGLTREVEVGAIFKGTVRRIMPFGAFVQILPGKDGLVHISELADHRVPSVESVVDIGDELEVIVVNVDRMGRIDLSARAVAEAKEGGRISVGGDDEDAGDDEPRRPPRPPRRDDRPQRGGRPHSGDRRGGERPRQRPFRDADRGGRRQVGGFRGDRRPPPPRQDD